MRYYIDTCIWIDYLEKRTTNNTFIECIKNQDPIIISDLLMHELLKYSNYSDFKMILKLLSAYNLLEHTEFTKEQNDEAIKITLTKSVPAQDALHAILARDSDSILITRDKHFLKLQNICRLKLL